MGNAKKTTGTILLVIGIVLILLGVIFIGISFAGVDADQEKKLADGNDFEHTLWGYYQYEVDSVDATSSLKVVVRSRSTNTIGMRITITNAIGEELTRQNINTPDSVTVDLSTDFSSSFKVQINFNDEDENMDDVEVTVYGSGPPSYVGALCCMGVIIPIIGIIVLIIGIILMVAGGKQEKRDARQWERKNDPFDTFSGSSGSYPNYQSQNMYGSTVPGSIPSSSYGQSSSGYGSYQPTPSQSGYEQHTDQYPQSGEIRIGYNREL